MAEKYDNYSLNGSFISPFISFTSGILVILAVVLALSVSVFAQDAGSAGQTENTTDTADGQASGQADAADNIDNISSGQGQPDEPEQITDFDMTAFVPWEFKVGDAQFSIQIKNTGNVELKNLVCIVTGKGFSAYDIVPIDSLKPDEKSYLLVMGNLKEAGNIDLTIKIYDREFHQRIKVTDPMAKVNEENEQKSKEEEQKKARELNALSGRLEGLKANYTALKNIYDEKKKDYDIAGIDLDADLKKFIQNAESNIIAGDIKQANISLTLGSEEYTNQRSSLENAKQIKKSMLESIKNNILIFSTIAASIITLITFYEVMKRKKEDVSKKLSETKIPRLSFIGRLKGSKIKGGRNAKTKPKGKD